MPTSGMPTLVVPTFGMPTLVVPTLVVYSSGADLRYANLDGAKLEGANVKETFLRAKTSGTSGHLRNWHTGHSRPSRMPYNNLISKETDDDHLH
jgi:hypothetical protein